MTVLLPRLGVNVDHVVWTDSDRGVLATWQQKVHPS